VDELTDTGENVASPIAEIFDPLGDVR